MQSGDIVLFRFPQTDLVEGKLRPALLISKTPGEYNDWLICMISSQTHQLLADFDEYIGEDAPDFIQSGLKASSVIRISRLAIVDAGILIGAIGQISPERLSRIRERLANWIKPE